MHPSLCSEVSVGRDKAPSSNLLVGPQLMDPTIPLDRVYLETEGTAAVCVRTLIRTARGMHVTTLAKTINCSRGSRLTTVVDSLPNDCRALSIHGTMKVIISCYEKGSPAMMGTSLVGDYQEIESMHSITVANPKRACTPQ